MDTSLLAELKSQACNMELCQIVHNDRSSITNLFVQDQHQQH